MTLSWPCDKFSCSGFRIVKKIYHRTPQKKRTFNFSLLINRIIIFQELFFTGIHQFETKNYWNTNKLFTIHCTIQLEERKTLNINSDYDVYMAAVKLLFCALFLLFPYVSGHHTIAVAAEPYKYDSMTHFGNGMQMANDIRISNRKENETTWN